jgi:hypothetical protein
MKQRTIHFTSTQADQAPSDLCTLRICIGPAHLAYSVRDLSNSCYALKSFCFQLELPLDDLVASLEEDPLLLNTFQEVEIAWFSPIETYLPRRMFLEGMAEQYLQTLTDQPLGEICIEEVSPAQLICVSSIHQPFFTFLKTRFPHAKHRLQSAQLLRHWRNELQHKPRVYLHLHPNHLQLAAFESTNLLFFNSFKYDTPADVLYYTLLVYQQLQWDPATIHLSISGEILQNSEIYKQLTQFIGLIRFTSTPTLFGLPTNLPSHTYICQTIN